MQENVTFWGLFDKQRQMIVFIVLATAGFFWQVVIPIGKIQTTLALIQISIEKQEQFKTDVARQLSEHDKAIGSIIKDVTALQKQN